ncbi:MAG TPA: hypothetical protein DIS79_03760 [Bacteroidetes bacterium]|nr:hypothetical protein [Bacteroidota bacterium]HRK03974.1 MazG nucleotide pyrophosphohydrolase domain-containing protein [Chlorobiota bacterium]
MSRTNLPSEGQHLVQVVLTNLSGIQDSFDAYQQAHFLQRPPEFFALELCGEVGELANLEKKRWRGTNIDDQHVADEAADVLIALMNFCNARGIQLAEAVAAKLHRITPTK